MAIAAKLSALAGRSALVAAYTHALARTTLPIASTRGTDRGDADRASEGSVQRTVGTPTSGAVSPVPCFSTVQAEEKGREHLAPCGSDSCAMCGRARWNVVRAQACSFLDRASHLASRDANECS